MKAVSEEYARLNEIVYSKIPVSEDSPIYNFFSARREICKTMVETDRQCYLDYLEKIEDNIKQYLLL